MDQTNILKRGLIHLIMSSTLLFFSCKEEKKLLLQTKANYGLFQLFTDSTGILLNEQTNEKVRFSKCSFIQKGDIIIVNVFDYEILKYNLKRKVKLKTFDPQNIIGEIGVKLNPYPFSSKLFLYNTKNRVIFMDENLTPLFSPIDTILSHSKNLRKELHSDWKFNFDKKDSIQFVFKSLLTEKVIMKTLKIPNSVSEIY